MMMRRKGCDEGIREHEKGDAAGCICVYLSTIFSFLPHLLPQFDDAAQDANEYIRVHAPLVCFVDDDDRVFGEQEVGGELAQEDTIRHELD